MLKHQSGAIYCIMTITVLSTVSWCGAISPAFSNTACRHVLYTHVGLNTCALVLCEDCLLPLNHQGHMWYLLEPGGSIDKWCAPLIVATFLLSDCTIYDIMWQINFIDWYYNCNIMLLQWWIKVQYVVWHRTTGPWRIGMHGMVSVLQHNYWWTLNASTFFEQQHTAV